MPTEETLVLVKPDGVARGLTGAILARIEAKGYSLVDIKLVEPDRDVLERHYAEHAGKPFYEPLVEFMLSGPSVAIRLAGNRVIDAITRARRKGLAALTSQWSKDEQEMFPLLLRKFADAMRTTHQAVRLETAPSTARALGRGRPQTARAPRKPRAA